MIIDNAFKMKNNSTDFVMLVYDKYSFVNEKPTLFFVTCFPEIKPNRKNKT